ncbi:hypothetical protein EDB87DRAFT_303662 [Lactarius vividus]|nr:hypothetical protein EDB87DRAFT_303662 [Lactarius vividus]
MQFQVGVIWMFVSQATPSCLGYEIHIEWITRIRWGKLGSGVGGTFHGVSFATSVQKVQPAVYLKPSSLRLCRTYSVIKKSGCRHARAQKNCDGPIARGPSHYPLENRVHQESNRKRLTQRRTVPRQDFALSFTDD